MTTSTFYNDSFSLVIDPRSIENRSKVGTGRKIVNTQSRVLVEVKKIAVIANVMCHIFVLADGLVRVVNNDLQSIEH